MRWLISGVVVFSQIQLLFALPVGGHPLWGVAVIAGVLIYGATKIRRVIG